MSEKKRKKNVGRLERDSEIKHVQNTCLSGGEDDHKGSSKKSVHGGIWQHTGRGLGRRVRPSKIFERELSCTRRLRAEWP